MATPWTQALEWRIAWRHLRVGETHPRWVDLLIAASLFLLLTGAGFIAYAMVSGPPPEPGEQIFSAAVATAQQRNFGVFGLLSVALGGMLFILGMLARVFNLLATIITMSVLLGCMALVVVLSLMSGLEVDLRDKILNQKAHLRISGANGNRFTDYEALTDAISELPEVAGASPYLEAEIMVRSGINRQGAVLLGVTPERLLTVSNIADIMSEGSFDALEHPESIPDADPFGSGSGETPWRLRHLDKDKAKSKAKPKPKTKTGKLDELPKRDAPKLNPYAKDDPEPDPKKGEGEADAKAEESALNEAPAGSKSKPALPPPPPPPAAGLPGNIPPPPAEFTGRPKGLPGPFGPDGLPGFAHLGSDDDEDEGWEDPVEVLGLDANDPSPAPTPAPKPTADGGEWGEGDDWEDPEEVLGLPDLPAEGEGTPGSAKEVERGPAPGGEGESEPFANLGEDEEDEVEAIVDPILLGRELANELAVGLGARVQLITPVGRLTPAGRVPGILASKVGGIFHSGMYEYDRKNVYTQLPVAQAFLRTGDRITGIEVKLHDVDAIDGGKAAVEALLREQGRSAPYLERTVTALISLVEDPQQREALHAELGIDVDAADGQLIVESWKELNRNLFSAMFLEKIAMFVALLFVVLVASFGILASNLMSVLEKSKEIAIMKAMGAQDQLIRRVFVAEGLVLGLLGAVGGITVGLILCLALDTFGFPFNENVYYIERLPVVVNPVEVAIVGVAALAIVWLSSLYPARVASRMRPVDGLRQQDK
ncbi:hypothetical protein PPSIR1_10090 [Plesiocystis pacifica SIR-1]|uniref:Uncharacterized protein n=1 Tax=Plesiocystis pacifica SIR-1 TaxID=391625 RepID=A6GJB8_9BACT|nr:FtsX-like permease family protein [Plesiocystis pacifica]EDM74036.1 hypothetical protein PPSIR1_10090 [Plesiocystis pacifica SIR-1]